MAYYRLNSKVEVSVEKVNGNITKATIRKTNTEDSREYCDKTRAGIVAYFEDNPECGDSRRIAIKLDLSQACVEQHIKALVMEGYLVDVTEEYELFD